MEGDAGTRQLNPTDADETPDESLAVSTEDQFEVSPEETAADEPADGRRPSRLGTGWVATICVAFLLLSAGAAAGGYLALRSNAESKALARAETEALQAAKDCVAATQAPDTAAMNVAQSKIIECSTGDFGVQAPLYASVIAEAYQVANVRVEVSDMRAAVEKHNEDGSIDVLVALRTKVTNSEAADQQQGYRLRVKMAREDGAFKVARMDQVTS